MKKVEKILRIFFRDFREAFLFPDKSCFLFRLFFASCQPLKSKKEEKNSGEFGRVSADSFGNPQNPPKSSPKTAQQTGFPINESAMQSISQRNSAFEYFFFPPPSSGKIKNFFRSAVGGLQRAIDWNFLDLAIASLFKTS